MEDVRQSSPVRGRLKIFFGYAPGVGKTYAMLKAGQAAKRRGVDTVVGCAEAHGCPSTAALLRGLERLPSAETGELDPDAALKRRPELLLVDELAHRNREGSRHAMRWQDVKELLAAGIDVCTTVNVRSIESLHDIVAAVTGREDEDRIPDSMFDGAEQVELVDIEPEELVERRVGAGAEGGAEELGRLTALREIALRRCADRINLLAENNGAGRGYRTDEHILVCLSPAPSNAAIIRTAARMAAAFRGTFTAVFVETSAHASMRREDRARLQEHMRLAERLGARIETVYGEDIPLQIAEFARLSGVTRLVIGRSTTVRRRLFARQTLTERLIANAPGLDVHIIPDPSPDASPYRERKPGRREAVVFSALDILRCIAILTVCSLIGFLFRWLDFDEANIITVYVLGVLVASVVTKHQIYSLIASIVSVLVFNFLFTEPRFTFHAYGHGYPVTFVIMFVAAFLTGSLAIRLKEHAKLSAQAAFRTGLLFDTNRLLQKARGREEILSAACSQLVKLLGRDIVFYPSEGGSPGEPRLFPAEGSRAEEGLISEREREVAAWTMKNNRQAGATTDTFSEARCLYLAVRVGSSVYGAVGVAIDGQPPDAFGRSVMLSILGECALALENEKNAREKEEAAVLAKNEQLRADLLRTISHDLRTPLTSISGNASNLLSNGESFDPETKKQLYADIYDDSMWLINLVENLLAVTRIDRQVSSGQIDLKMSENLIDEVIDEALHHISRKSAEHRIRVERGELLLARMDAGLIVQVVINLVDNAVKYTPVGSEIVIGVRKQGDRVLVSVSDDGPGIPDEKKARIFDMFYSGANRVADSRRSIGLGLSLCRSIISAHGGEITVSDNSPHGAVFTFSLPAADVRLHE